MLKPSSAHWRSGIALEPLSVYLKHWDFNSLSEPDNVYTQLGTEVTYAARHLSYSLVSSKGVGWHTDPLAGYKYSYILILVNQGFQVLQDGLPIKAQRRGDILALNLLKRHCLAQVKYKLPSMRWMGLALDTDTQWPNTTVVAMLQAAHNNLFGNPDEHSILEL